MSGEDDVSFFDVNDGDLASELEPAEESTITEAALPADSVTLSRQEWSDMLAFREQQKQWQADLANVVTGRSSQDQPMTKEQKALMMLQDPDSYEQKLEERILQKNQQQLQALQTGTIVDQYKQTYPEYSKYEHYVIAELGQVARQNQTEGKQVDFRTALNQAIQNFEGKFGSVITGGNASNAVNRMAMQFDLKNGAAPSGTGKKDIWAMSDAEFDALDKQIKSKFYQ